MASKAHAKIVAELRATPPRPDLPIEEVRHGFESFAIARFRPPPGVARRAVDAGGIPSEWLIPEAVEDRVVLYIHGGGYCMGSLDTHRGLAGHLAQAAAARVLSIGYRLAPEHPFPAARDDCVAAYRWLLKQGWGPGRIILAGDSAGGGLVLSALQVLRDLDLPQPVGAVCFSPVTDLAKEGASMQTRAHLDPWVDPVSSAAHAERYLAGRDPRDPAASPLHADQRGLPPTLVMVGDWEVLRDDSIRWAERAHADGVEVELEIWPEMFHVWPLFADEMPEARQAVLRAGDFIRRHTPVQGP